MLCPVLLVILLLTDTVRPWMVIVLSAVVGVTDALSMAGIIFVIPRLDENPENPPCESPGGRFSSPHDPPPFPRQRIAPRPDRTGPRRRRRAPARPPPQRARAAGRWPELGGDRPRVVSRRRHHSRVAQALPGGRDRGAGDLQPRRWQLPADGGAAGDTESLDRRDLASLDPSGWRLDRQ